MSQEEASVLSSLFFYKVENEKVQMNLNTTWCCCVKRWVWSFLHLMWAVLGNQCDGCVYVARSASLTLPATVSFL